MSYLAFDIGGANLKAADGRGWARGVPFALCREAGTLHELAATAPPSSRWAVTMTGELCDVFRTKAEGVRGILGSVAQAAAGRKVLEYLVDGRLASIREVSDLPNLAATSNWHVLARFAARFIEQRSGLLIDIGTTGLPVERTIRRGSWRANWFTRVSRELRCVRLSTACRTAVELVR